MLSMGVKFQLCYLFSEVYCNQYLWSQESQTEDNADDENKNKGNLELSIRVLVGTCLHAPCTLHISGRISVEAPIPRIWLHDTIQLKTGG